MVLKTNNFFKKESIFDSNVRRQFLASIVVNFVTFSHGMALGWVAPTIQTLTSNETPLDFKMSLAEASWMASLIGIGCMVGNLVLGNLINIIGRKICLFIMPLGNICLWICIYFATSVEYLYVGRFIGGIAAGSALALVPLFVNEIADAVQRGAFHAFFTTALNLGVLTGYLLTSNLSYHLVPCIAVVLPTTYLFLLLFFPETPQYLIRKGHDERAMNSFRFYKNYPTVTPKCEQELNELKATIMKSKTTNKLVFKDFTTKPALKAYVLNLVLLVLHQFSGINSFITYMSDIFTLSSAPLEPNTCTIIMGIVQLLGNFTTMLFIDHCGRKVLLIISSVGVILSEIAFGCFTYLKETHDLTSYTWVPLVLMILILFLGNIGILSVGLISAVENLPVKIRSTAFSISLATWSFFVFVSLKIFPIFMFTLGLNITMWSCAGIIALCLLYIIIFLPETKGKSMDID